MHFGQINGRGRHFVGRIVEIVVEQLEIAFVDFPHQMHRQIVKIILDRMQPLRPVTFAFVEPGDLFQINFMSGFDVFQNQPHAFIEFLGEKDVVIAPPVHNVGRNMPRHCRPVNVGLHRFFEPDGVTGEQQKPPETGNLVKLGAANLTNNYVVQAYGSPAVGGLYYLSLNFDDLLR